MLGYIFSLYHNNFHILTFSLYVVSILFGIFLLFVFLYLKRYMSFVKTLIFSMIISLVFSVGMFFVFGKFLPIPPSKTLLNIGTPYYSFRFNKGLQINIIRKQYYKDKKIKLNQNSLIDIKNLQIFLQNNHIFVFSPNVKLKLLTPDLPNLVSVISTLTQNFPFQAKVTGKIVKLSNGYLLTDSKILLNSKILKIKITGTEFIAGNKIFLLKNKVWITINDINVLYKLYKSYYDSFGKKVNYQILHISNQNLLTPNQFRSYIAALCSKLNAEYTIKKNTAEIFLKLQFFSF